MHRINSPMINKLILHSSHYFIGRSVLMFAGFISFPLFTRIFSVSDYGILGLISTTIMIASAFCKMGYPSFIIRYHEEAREKKKIKAFYSTLILATSIISGVISLVIFLGMALIRDRIPDITPNMTSVIIISIFATSLIAIMTTFLRADQETYKYNLLIILQKYLSLAIGIILAVFVIKGIYGFYVGQAIAGVALLISLLYIYRANISIRNNFLSKSIFINSLKYGGPLVFAEIGYLFLTYIDRYLIQCYLGPEMLGFYSAGYNLAIYATELILYSLNFAMGPILMNILQKEGEKEAKVFITKSFKYFAFIIVAVGVAFIEMRTEILGILASEKFLKASEIIPYVVISQIIYASGNVLNAGLYIKQKTYIVTLGVAIGGIVSVASNIYLIPKYGLMGAAYASLISNAANSLFIIYYSHRMFPLRIEIKSIIIYAISGIASYLVLDNIHVGVYVYDLILKICLGLMVYMSLVLYLDKEIRNIFLKICKRH